MSAVLNAANEIAVQAFLDGRIRLSEIAEINEAAMDEHEPVAASTLEAVLYADEWARERAIMKISNEVVAV
jgi:1-deoxy-D-xylulose-5-phosphate reductoisomerase